MTGPQHGAHSNAAVVMQLDHRLELLNAGAKCSPYERKKSKLEGELDKFMTEFLLIDVGRIRPKDICRFLVMKDKGGKTAVHIPICKSMVSVNPNVSAPDDLLLALLSLWWANLGLFSRPG